MKADDIDIVDEPPVASVEFIGGSKDGERFFLVKSIFKDGSTHYVWISNLRDGVFRQVFAPYDLTHPDLIG
jgi:hypothetical protein